MNTKHTPGPWFSGQFREAGADPRFNGCDIGAANGANVAIALHDPIDRSGAETKANARLIAAAPDLLKACEQALYALKGREHDKFLRDAIAKARGAT